MEENVQEKNQTYILLNNLTRHNRHPQIIHPESTNTHSGQGRLGHSFSLYYMLSHKNNLDKLEVT
jgi:hypothetical protein